MFSVKSVEQDNLHLEETLDSGSLRSLWIHRDHFQHYGGGGKGVLPRELTAAVYLTDETPCQLIVDTLADDKWNKAQKRYHPILYWLGLTYKSKPKRVTYGELNANCATAVFAFLVEANFPVFRGTPPPRSAP